MGGLFDRPLFAAKAVKPRYGTIWPRFPVGRRRRAASKPSASRHAVPGSGTWARGEVVEIDAGRRIAEQVNRGQIENGIGIGGPRSAGEQQVVVINIDCVGGQVHVHLNGNPSGSESASPAAGARMGSGQGAAVVISEQAGCGIELQLDAPVVSAGSAIGGILVEENEIRISVAVVGTKTFAV